MRRWIFFFFIFYLVGLGTFDMSESMQSCALAQGTEISDTGGAKNYFLRGGGFILGFVILWFFFYKLVYPHVLLRYYSPGYCKNLFWSIFLLYSMAWLSISTYVIFEIGFRYYWAKWVFVFFGALWLIWLMVILLKKDTAYT